MANQDKSKEEMAAELVELKSQLHDLEKHSSDRREYTANEASKFRSIIDQIGDSIACIDVENSDFIDCNETTLKWLGYNREEFLSLKVADVEVSHHPLSPEQWRTRVQEIRRADSASVSEGVHRRKDGSTFPVEVTLTYQDTGEKACILVVARDISERKKSEAELRNSEERYRTVVESMSEGLLITDIDDVGLFVNARLVELTGFTAEEFIGRKVHQLLLPPEKWPAILERHKQRLMGQPETYQMEIIRKDGTALWMLINAAPYPGPDGQPIGAIVLFADLTEHRQIEAELLQSQKMEVIGQLTSGIAHNFNNLLVPIQGNLELVLPTCPAEFKASIEDAHDASVRAADLVRQLMTYSRRQSIFPQHKPLAPAAILGEVCEICRTTFDRKIEVHLDAPEALPPVLGDSSQLHTVFLNLCLNARDALNDLEDRTPTLDIRAGTITLNDPLPHPEARAGDFIRFELADNGAGMNPDIQSRIFDPFFTTKEVGQGTGLGLSTAFGIVKQHDGWIDCQSATGTGTSFSVYLPITDAQAPTAPAKRSADALEGSGTILVVDDEELVRATITRLLTRHGYQVLTAKDGTEGLATFQAHQAEIAMVFLDLSMPGLSGRQVLERLRAIDPEVKVVVFTGHTTAAKEFTDVPFLSKPLRNQIIIRTLQDLLHSQIGDP